MDNKLTYAEYKELFRKNDDGSYKSLIIPAAKDLPELNLSGKLPADYTVDEIIRMKKYAGEMFRLVDKSTM